MCSHSFPQSQLPHCGVRTSSTKRSSYDFNSIVGSSGPLKGPYNDMFVHPQDAIRKLTGTIAALYQNLG